MKLILIRHGRTPANERHAYLGRTDEPLTEAAFSLIKEKRDSGFYPDPAGFKIYTSGMRRTEETLRAVYGVIPHGVIPAMRETDFGDFECRTYEELKDNPAYIEWISDSLNAAPPGGESFPAMKERVMAAVNELLNRNEDAIVFTHGGPITASMLTLFPDAGKNFYEWNPRHGGGYVITSENGNFEYTEL